VEEHIALQAPAGLPPDIIRRANAAAKAAMEAAETRQRLATLAVVPRVTSPDDWPAYFAAENAKWRDMVRARNIRVQ
jgi:tripartite-type tricarboxylate transporter receptor subunit TctC